MPPRVLVPHVACRHTHTPCHRTCLRPRTRPLTLWEPAGHPPAGLGHVQCAPGPREAQGASPAPPRTLVPSCGMPPHACPCQNMCLASATTDTFRFDCLLFVCARQLKISVHLATSQLDYFL